MRWVDNSSHSKSSLRNCKGRWPKPRNVQPLSKWPLVKLSILGGQPLRQKTSGHRRILSGLPSLAPFHREIIETEFSTAATSGGCPRNPFSLTTIVDSTCPFGSGTKYAGDTYRTRTTLCGSRANPFTHYSTSPRCLCFCNSTTHTSKAFG